MHRRFRFDRIIRSKRVMRWALVFLFVAISSMTIVYASLSTTLSIRGSAEFKDASWDIVVEEMEMYDGYNFTKDGNAALYGSAKLLNRPTILGTSITNFNIEIAQVIILFSNSNLNSYLFILLPPINLKLLLLHNIVNHLNHINMVFHPDLIH